MKEREISLFELLTETMLHWRAIFICMIAGAILAGVFSYVRSCQTLEVSGVNEQGQLQEQDQMQYKEELEDKLTDTQLQNVKYVIDYEAVYQEKLAYQEKSLLMQMDANCVQRSDLTFYVSADHWRDAGSIEKVYEDMVQGGELTRFVAKQIHANDTSNVSQALSLARGAGSLPEGSNTFRISIIHYDQAVMRDMAKAAVDFFDSKHDQIEKIMGKHKVIVANQSETVVTDMNILENQKSVIDDIASMETTILQYKGAFTDEQQQYYDLLTETTDSRDGADTEEKPQEPDDGNHAASLGISKKYVVLGMFLAAFLYVFVFFMRYVFNNRLHSTDSLQELYEIPQLGMIPQEQESRQLFGFVDQWILSLRDSGRCRFQKAEALQLSAAAVRMAAVKEGTDRVCLTGCGLTGRAMEACETIRNSLAGEGIQVEILNNILYDAQAMSSLEKADGAVLVACAQCTLYSELVKEKQLLHRQGITVLGGIVVA